MPSITATRIAKTFSLDDGERRGPLSLSRLRFHPTARVLFGACADRRLGLWDLDAAPQAGRTGDVVPGRFVCAHDAGWVRGFDVSPRGDAVATGGSDRRLKLWAWENGGVAERPRHDVEAHEGWVEAVAFSPDGQRLATVGADRRVKLWNAANLQLIKAEAAHAKFPRDLAFSPDGRWLVTGGEDGVAIVWNASTLEVVRRIDTGTANDQQGQTPGLSGILRVSVSHDGRWLGLGCDRTSMIFELETGHGVASLAQAGVDNLFGRRRNLLAAGDVTLKLSSYDPSGFRPAPAPIRRDPRGAALPLNLPAFAGTEILQHRRGEFAMSAALSADDGLFAAGKTDGKADVWTLS